MPFKSPNMHQTATAPSTSLSSSVRRRRRMSYQIRSVSFPARSQHPIISRIENELNKLQSWQHDESISTSSTMAESVFFSLSRLEELQGCMDEILALQSTRQALSNAHHSSFVDSLLDASLKLLDVCGGARDAVLEIKEHVLDLQTAMRRRRVSGAHELESIASNYICFRKRMCKEAKRNMSILKQIEQALEGSLPKNHPDHEIICLIGAIKDVILTNASIFESLLMFVSARESKIRGGSKWSLASRFMITKVKNCSNEFGQLDAEICSLEDGSRLQRVNIIADGMESSLERLFRCLIKTRTSFLNIRSY